jgi:hypothetical protein
MLALLFTSWSEVVQAQSVSTVINFEVAGGLMSSYRILSYDGESQFYLAVVSGKDEREVPRPGFMSGIGLRICHSNNIEVGVGIRYADYTYKTKAYDHYVGIVGSTISTHVISFTNIHHQVLELPISLGYKVAVGKLDIVPSAGIFGSYYMNYRTLYHNLYDDGREETIVSSFASVYEFRRYHFGLHGRCLFQFSLGERLSFGVAPTFSYYLSQLQEWPISEHLFGYGINASLQFNIE